MSQPLLRPQKLVKGDFIGLITPASPVADSSLVERGVRYLESQGYRVVVGENVGKRYGYLAGTDEERAADLHSMFEKKEVKAIFCLRGGYGTPRLLSLINYKRIARNPKIFVGYSDVTALQLAFWTKCRLITFHGPMAGVEMAQQMDPFTEEMFWRCVTSSQRLGAIPLSEDVQVLRKGEARGRLLGGNLSLLVSVLGTPYQPDFSGAIIFAEETSEEPYRVDRMMTHLHNAGVFRKASGLVLGQFTGCIPTDATKPSLSTEEVLRNSAQKFAKPALANLPFGHAARTMTLPVGVRVRFDGGRRLLEFTEPAVR